MTEIRKIGQAVDYNTTAVRWDFYEFDPDWHRRSRLVSETTPTETEWAAYRRAVELWDELAKNPYFDCTDPEIEEPEPKRVYEYTETEDEYRARIAQWEREGRKPRDPLADLKQIVYKAALHSDVSQAQEDA